MRTLLLLLACIGAGSAQTIRGTVVDAQTGEALARVRVQLLASPHETVSDAQGRFELDGVQPGGYTLHVSTVGYRIARREFELAPGETKEFEVVLSPDMFRQADSVEVRADVFEPVHAESVSELTLVGAEVKNLASVLADDPLRAIHALPGVTSNDDFNATFSLRGAPHDRIGLYLDDILLHQPFHTVQDRTASGTLTIFNGDMVQDMSLMSGAFPARYGDRTAGALDVRMREGTRQRTSVRGTASASNAGLMAEGPVARGKGAWIASIRKSYLQYLIDRTSGGNDPSLAGGFWDAQSRLSYDLSSAHNFTLSAFEGKSGMNREKARDRLGINSIMGSDYQFTLGTAAWRWTPAEKAVITSRAAWMREKYVNENRERRPLASGHYGEWAWSTGADWEWGERRTLEAGFSRRWTKDAGYFNRYQFNPAAVQRLDEFSGRSPLAGAFVQHSQGVVGGRVRVTGGLRWDRHESTGAAVISPRASMALSLTGSTRLSLGWGQYAQFPGLELLYSRIGGLRLRPERALHAVASLEQRFSERSRMRIEAYQRLDRDLIYRPFEEPRLVAGRIFNPPLDAPAFNSLRGYARGLEIFYQRRTANRFTGWAGYSLSYARMRDGISGARFWADEDQRHSVNAYASYRIRPTVNLSTKWVYGSGLPVPGFLTRSGDAYYLAPERNQVRLEPYERTDIRVNKAWIFDRWKVTLFGEVVNIFDRDNRRFDAFNGYNASTGAARPGFSKMLPVLPSAGVVLEF